MNPILRKGFRDNYLAPFLAILMFLSFNKSYAQTYNASAHVVVNDAIGPAQSTPVDSRSMFYDANLFLYRPYNGTTEVLSYLNTSKSRFGNFIIVVDSGGILQPNGHYINGHNTYYMFSDSTGNANLVKLNLFGGAGVTSFNSRTGAVVPQSGDYTFAQIGSTPTTVAGYGITDAVSLNGTQTLTNKTMSGLSNTFSNIPASALAQNSIGLTITSNPAADISVTTSPAILGNSLIFNVPTASATQRGALRSSDFSFFFSKLDTVHLSNDTLYNCSNGNCVVAGVVGGGGGSGTVTNFTSGNLGVGSSAFMTTSVATSSTTPAQTFALVNAPGHSVWGDSAVSTGAPLYYSPNSTILGEWFGGPIQGAINLTTTGTSGAATLIGNTLNIPNYSGGGGGTPNSNRGTGYRLAEIGNAINTLYGSLIIIDSTTNTGLTFTADTTAGNQKLATQGYVGRTFQPIGNYITATTGDVVATGPGIVPATIQANAVTTSKINNAAVTLGKMATNTVNSLLGYDGSGNPTDVTLTTTGTTGAATLSGSVLNIPQYQGALTLTLTGSGNPTLISNTLNIPAPTLTYTQNATNNTLAINPGNSQTFLIATNLKAGLLDTARVNYIDSGRNRLFTFHYLNGLQPLGTTGDSAGLGGNPFYQNTTLNTAGFQFNITNLPSQASLSAGDSVPIFNLATKQMKLVAPSVFVTSGLTAPQLSFGTPQKISSPLGIGYWDDHSFSNAGATQNYTTAGTVTLAQNGNFLKFRGGTIGTYTNYFYKNILSYSEWMTNWTKVSADSIGATYGELMWGKGSGGNPLIGVMDLRTGGSHTMTIVSNGTTVATKTPATLAPAQGDSLNMEWYFHQDTVRFAVYDLTSSVADSVQYVFPSTTFNDATTGTYPTFGNYTLGAGSGAFTMVSQTVTTNNPYRPIVVGLGHSIMQGYDGGSFANRITERLASTFGYVPDFGSSGDVFANVESRLMDVIRIQPRNAIVYIGCNDVRNLQAAGWTTAQIMAEVKAQMGALVSRLQRAQIWPIIIYTPETGSVATLQYEADSLLRVTWPQYYCAVYDTIASNTASFITGSGGIHLSSAGMAAAAQYIINHANLQLSTYVPNVVAGGEGYPTLGDTAHVFNTWTFDTRPPQNTTYGIPAVIINEQDSAASVGSNMNMNKYAGTTAGVNFEQMRLTGSNWATSSTFQDFFAAGSEVYKTQVDGTIFTNGSINSFGTSIPFKNSRGDTWNMAYDAGYYTGDNLVLQEIIPSGGAMRVEAVTGGPILFTTNGTTYGMWFDPGKVHAGSSPSGFPFGITGSASGAVPTFNVASVMNNLTWTGTAQVVVHGNDSVIHQIPIGVGLAIRNDSLVNTGSGSGGGTSPPFSDGSGNPLMKNVADNTKLFAIDNSGITTGTTITMTVPNANFTPAGLGLTQTFTGGNTFSAGVTLGSVTNATPLTATNSLTGTNTSSIALFTSTWNVGTTTETGMDFSIVNTASNAASLAFRIRAGASGSTDEFHILASDGSVTNASGKYGTSATTFTLSNSSISFVGSFASLYGTTDAFIQGHPAGTGYSVFEDVSGIGVVLSTIGAHPIKFAPNRVVDAQFFGSGNLGVGTATDNNGFIQIGANTTTIASMFFNGAASDVTSPTNGMLWYNSTTHALNFRDNGATVNLLSSATGVTTVGAFSGSSQTNGASISTNTITFGPADATNPGMIKASGAQTLGATLTLSNALTVNAAITTSSGNGINISAKNDVGSISGVGTITSYAVPGSGSQNNFEVAAYVNIQAVVTDVIEVQVTFTGEDNASHTVNMVPQGATSPNLGSVQYYPMSPIFISVKKGTTITVATSFVTSSGSITYDNGAIITQMY